jgi:SAM-dependent methyltransferase
MTQRETATTKAEATSACRSCGGAGLVPVLDLGETPLANSLLAEADLARPEPRFPLALIFCPHCSLVQTTVSVPPEAMFREYLYFSSFSDTMLRHAEALAGRLTAARGLGPESLVVEAASNDGYLLQYYRRAGVPVLGIEPARNVAEVAERERGVPTLCEFFGVELGQKLAAEGRRADVFHANNVLAHVPDLNGFVGGIAALLKPGGLAVIEAPYVDEMVQNCEFDTIYHEHLCYFSLTAIDALFRRHGLRVVDVERLDIHGGSLRYFGAPAAQAPEPSPAVATLLADERARGVDRAEYYRSFAGRVAALKTNLTALLHRLKAEGKRVCAYGASAKGSTLLNTFGIGREVLDYAVDRSTYKQGRYIPGVRVPIVAPSRLLEDRPDYTLLLTWNFRDEILEQQAEYRRAGGKFIVPVPEPVIV